MKIQFSRLAAIALFSCGLQTDIVAQTCNQGQTPSTPTSQFTAHGDGTVTHRTTGLMWKVCSEGQSWSNPGGVATCSGGATGHDFVGALALAEGQSFAGHSDWRMPSVQELASIIETCRGDPILNTINNVVFPATPSTIFWTGSPNASTSAAWSVTFNSGFALSDRPRFFSLQVRLVRGGQSINAAPNLANGYCGVAANSPQLVAPTAGLCADLSMPGVTATQSAFTWQCAGAVNGANNSTGATVNCATLRQYTVTAQPNPANAGGRLDCMATTGSALGVTAPVTTNQTATCLATPNPGYRTISISGCGGATTGAGVNSVVSGAVAADCAVTATFDVIPSSGICGQAQNAFSATAPASNLCASKGGNGGVTQVGINWNWTCNGSNGGTNAACTAPATACTMDIDGDGIVNSTIDAFIHARIAVGMTGPDVLNGLNIPIATPRRDWTSIRDHLNARCGMTLL
jgi:Protein of unknown function (DUF1566)